MRNIKYNKEGSGFATHIPRNTRRYARREDSMENIDHVRKGRIMNMKHKFTSIQINAITH
jgi:hypothetical protein